MRWYQRFFRRDLTEKHLDAELRFHLDQRIADLVATGMAPEEARRRARLEFGSLDQVKEVCRDVGAGRFVETLILDMRFGLRTLFKDRGFVVAAVQASQPPEVLGTPGNPYTMVSHFALPRREA